MLPQPTSGFAEATLDTVFQFTLGFAEATLDTVCCRLQGFQVARFPCCFAKVSPRFSGCQVCQVPLLLFRQGFAKVFSLPGLPGSLVIVSPRFRQGFQFARFPCCCFAKVSPRFSGCQVCQVPLLLFRQGFQVARFARFPCCCFAKVFRLPGLPASLVVISPRFSGCQVCQLPLLLFRQGFQVARFARAVCNEKMSIFPT
jgi:hypothetical protein